MQSINQSRRTYPLNIIIHRTLKCIIYIILQAFRAAYYSWYVESKSYYWRIFMQNTYISITLNITFLYKRIVDFLCLSAHVSVWLFVCLIVCFSLCLIVCFSLCLIVCFSPCLIIWFSLSLIVCFTLWLIVCYSVTFNVISFAPTDSLSLYR